MDIREALRTSELWALVAAVVLSTLKFHNLVDPVEADGWVKACIAYGVFRFVSKTAKASVPAANGGSK